MTFRNIDGSGDWIFGTGRNSYLTDNQEIALNIRTRVMSFLGDCFFATNEGIDYWNLLDYNKRDELENQIQSVIIQTPGVQAIDEIDLLIGANRTYNLTYKVTTIYSTALEGYLPLNV